MACAARLTAPGKGLPRCPAVHVIREARPAAGAVPPRYLDKDSSGVAGVWQGPGNRSIAGNLGSPLGDSNPRPLPYHGSRSVPETSPVAGTLDARRLA